MTPPLALPLWDTLPEAITEEPMPPPVPPPDPEPRRAPPHPIESSYFDIRYFKKGTVHLKWKRYDLLEQFSTTAAAGRKWIGDDRGQEER
jgi:hypothetical protein